jgi:hypothetical protein
MKARRRESLYSTSTAGGNIARQGIHINRKTKQHADIPLQG